MLIPAFGDFLYNTETKQIHFENEKPVGSSTYERAFSKPVWYQFFAPDTPLNPMYYATEDTATGIRLLVEKDFRQKYPGNNLVFADKIENVTGKVTHPQRNILVMNTINQKEETYSAGLWAFTRDKNGKDQFLNSLFFEFRQAGLI